MTAGIVGRRARRQADTETRLLRAAYSVISENGVDATRIKDITDVADVGFGTFYNYFEDKDAIASRVLDYMIEQLGERIRRSTEHLRPLDATLVMGCSNRLVLRATMTQSAWRWWAARPDLFFARLRTGFAPFAVNDIREAIATGRSALLPDQVDAAWTLASWAMVGGIHDVVVGDSPPDSEAFVAQSVLRLLGVSAQDAAVATQAALPDCDLAAIDWATPHPPRAGAVRA